MRKLCFISAFVALTLFIGKTAHTQDFSNKGKDFWVAYGYHQVMNGGGNLQEMVLYFATEAVTTVTVTTGTGYSQTYANIPANTVFTSNPIPKSGPQDARLLTMSTTPEKKGIHITADHPIVAYAHIYNSSVSGASILFPTNTLGKEYYSVNYTNISNSPNSNCWFYVVATDPGTTTVEIIPSAATTNPLWVPGNTYTITLNQGEVFNVMGAYSGASGSDLTGSVIRSVSSAGGGCKRIGVFSGSGRIAISCNGSTPSSDNYMVQAFPKTAWGKKYLTATAGGSQSNNFFRICISKPTNVRVNGVPIAVPLQNNFYYEIGPTNQPMLIEADDPIMVAQYFTSQGVCGNGSPGDPEVIYLSAVEQNISKVLWNATPNFAITQHWFNVVVPNGGTGISSFKLDGVTVNPALFTVDPQDANYSYMKYQLTGGPGGDGRGQHIIESDSGFNAIAYGFGQTESYGYNAGTNIKDIYQYITIQNSHASVNFPATCKGTDFTFSMTFPYQPDQIQWVFGSALNAMGIPDVTLGPPAPIPTGTTVVNGRTLYQYQLPTPYNITAVGTYPIKVIATNPTPDGCGGIQEIDFDLQVYDKPIAEFNFNTNGCLTSPVTFTDNAQNLNGRPVTDWYWDFGDLISATTQNTSHTYGASGSYIARHVVITDIGCISDTLPHTVVLSDPPVADFTSTGPYCDQRSITFTDASTVSAGNTINTWAWSFGDPASGANNTSSSQSPTHTFSGPGNYTVTLLVTTSSGCQSILKSIPVTIHANPTADFSMPSAVCLPAGLANFTDISTVPAGESIATWAWDFGDPPSGANNTSALQNPSHVYPLAQPYSVTLVATTANGCQNTKVKVLNSIYAEPQAAFNSPTEACVGSLIGFSDVSVALNSTVSIWHWDFGDPASGPNNTSATQNPTHIYATPGNYTVTLTVTSVAGCQSVTPSHIATHNILVKALPTAGISGSTTVCLNSTPQPVVTIIGAGGTAPFQFTYTINSGAPITVPSSGPGNSASITVPTNVVGTFRYQLVSVVEGGPAACSQNQNAFVDVVIKDLPTATISGATTVCLNAPATNITLTGAGGTAPYLFTYTINSGAPQTILSNAAGVANVPIVTTTAGTFHYEITNVKEGSGNACARALSGITVDVEVKPLPTATVTKDINEVCLNATTGPKITFTGANGSTDYTFIYNIDNGSGPGPNQTITTSGSSSVSLNVPTTTAGTFKYTLVGVTEGSGNACTQNLTGVFETVTINPLPTPNFNFAAPSCETRTISFNDVSVANAGTLNNWQWDFGDPASGAANTSALQNPSHTFATAGSYNVTLTVASDKGCTSAQKLIAVTINARPKAGFTTPIACTSDLNAPFTDTSKIATGTIVAWQWNFGDPASGPNNISNLQNPTHHFAVSNNYTVTLVVTSNNGCKDTTTNTMFVNGSVTVANFTVANPTALCSNQVVSLTDASTVDAGNLVKLEIYWDYSNDPTIKTVVNNPVTGDVYTHQYPEFGSPFTKTYTVRYIVYSGATCLNTRTQTITVLATPTLQFNAPPAVCSDAPGFQLTPQVTNGLPGPTGVFSGTGVSPTGMFDPTVGGGAYLIRYTFTGTNTCSNFIDQTVTIYPTPGANAGPDKVVLEGGTVTLTPALNAGLPVTYLWTPSAGLDNPTSPTPNASPLDDVTYQLIVTSDKGCRDTDYVFIKVLKKPLIPNIFSPNGDRIHDVWEIPFLESYPGCTIDIYNRYGQLIYHSIGYTKPWDGKINGKDAPIGTYYYIVDPKNGRAKMSGYVDVIR